jgi:hypothetical protein
VLPFDTEVAGEGKDAGAFDCIKFVEFALATEALFPGLYRPLLLLVGGSCLQFIVPWRRPATDDEDGAEVVGAQLSELFDVASPLPEAETCIPVVGAEF